MGVTNFDINLKFRSLNVKELLGRQLVETISVWFVAIK